MMKSLTFLLLFSIVKLSWCQFYPIYNGSPIHRPNTYFIVKPNLYNTIEYSSHVPTILIAKTPYRHPLQPTLPTQQPPPLQPQSVKPQKQHQVSFEKSRNGQQQQFQREQPKPFHTANKDIQTNVQNYQTFQNQLKQMLQDVYQQQQQQPVQLQGSGQQPKQRYQPIHSQLQPKIPHPPTIYLIFLQKSAPVYKSTDNFRPHPLATYRIPNYKSQSFKAESNLIQPGGHSKYPQAYPLPPPPQSALPRNIKMVVLNGPNFTDGGSQSKYLGHNPISAQFMTRVYSIQKQPHLYQYKNNFVH